MPELPEVEVTRRGIAHLVGRRLQRCQFANRDCAGAFPNRRPARGQTVSGHLRRGKYLLIDCGSGHLILHLGMSGSLRFVLPDGAAEA
jgi:formamidopyrimidine-DNA glycosylase